MTSFVSLEAIDYLYIHTFSYIGPGKLLHFFPILYLI